MESHPLSGAYEVRCHRCDCSFAPGTRRCLHCGERLGRELPAGGLLGAAEGEADEESEIGSPAFLRGALWVLTAVVALIMTAVRTCQSG